MSDYLYDAKSLTLNVQVIGFNGKRLRNLKEKINATANTSEVVKVYNVEELVTEKHLYMYVI